MWGVADKSPHKISPDHFFIKISLQYYLFIHVYLVCNMCKVKSVELSDTYVTNNYEIQICKITYVEQEIDISIEWLYVTIAKVFQKLFEF